MNFIETNTAGAAERTIVIERRLAAPRELVWKTWTEPEHLARWWGPAGFECARCSVDLRTGGAFLVELRANDGALYPAVGIIREIVPGRRLVFEGAPDGHPCGSGIPPNSLVTVTFEEHDAHTVLTITAHLASAADRVAALEGGYEPGWTSSLGRLDSYLAEYPVQ